MVELSLIQHFLSTYLIAHFMEELKYPALPICPFINTIL